MPVSVEPLPAPAPETVAPTKKPHLAHAQTLLAAASERLVPFLENPQSSLQQISLLAAQKLLIFLKQVAKVGVEEHSYFCGALSAELNVLLFEQIFHLKNQERFEEFLFKQMFGLHPQTLQPLPLSNRKELASQWMKRFVHSQQAIDVEITGIGAIRDLTREEQKFLAAHLESETLQQRAFPAEEQRLSKLQIDGGLEKFGRALKTYISYVENLPPLSAFSVTREQQRYEKLRAVYAAPHFIIYEYFRSLLDFIQTERGKEKINLVVQAEHSKNQKMLEHTGDKDLDRLFGKSSNTFVLWPTGDNQVYGQEQYLHHFMSQNVLNHIACVETIDKATTLTVFVFDVSGSMLVHDVWPSRFEYALDLQEDLLSVLDSTCALAQVVFSSMGIVSHLFGQPQKEFQDLLLDSRLWFHQARNALLADMFGYTSLGAGLLSAAALIEQTRNTLDSWGTLQPAQILLFTDGDHNCPPNFYQAAKFCQQLKIDVHPICCAKEICVEIETAEGASTETLQKIVTQEARERAEKIRFWYPEVSFERVLKKQTEIVLKNYHTRFQQKLQRSTGANVEALETIAEVTGGHFFQGAMGEKGLTTAEEILEILHLREKFRTQMVALKKKKAKQAQNQSNGSTPKGLAQ